MSLRLLPAATYVLTLVGVLLGNGVFGPEGGVGQAESLAATPTLLKPAGAAFGIWSLIYLLLLGYVIWQATDAGARSPRARVILWPAVGSLLLNAVWIVVVQVAGSVWGSVLVMLALLACLVLVQRGLAGHRPVGAVEKVLLGVTFGLYLGWINVATLANVTFAGVVSWPGVGAVVSRFLAVVVLAAALGVAAFVLPRVSEPVSVALAMAWGLSWIAVERLTTAPESLLVAVVAIAVAVGVLVMLGGVLRDRRDPRTARAARGPAS